MKRALALTLGLLLTLTAPATSESGVGPAVEEASRGTTARLGLGGGGFLVSKEGCLVVPKGLLKGPGPFTAVLDGKRLGAELVFRDERHSFALLRLPSGEYPTVALGDLSLLQTGNRLYTAAGSSELQRLETDVARNEQYAVIDLPFAAHLVGTPVFDRQLRVVGAVVGPEGSGATAQTRVVSARAVKMALFEAGWPPLQANLHPALQVENVHMAGSGATSGPEMELWEFPMAGGGSARTERMLALQEVRESFGVQGELLTPLALDNEGRLYLATHMGSVYCLDFESRTMLWRAELDPLGVTVYSPLPYRGGVLLSNGNIGLWTRTTGRLGLLSVDLLVDLAGRVDHHLAINQGGLHSLGPDGVERWKAIQRFPSPPVPFGDQLLVSGLGFRGAVNGAGGSYLWHESAEKGKAHTRWHSIQAVDESTAYELNLQVGVHGGAESRERLRLRAESDVAVVAFDPLTKEERWRRVLKDTEPGVQPLGLRLDLDGDLLHLTLPEQRLGLRTVDGETLYRYPRTDRALSDRITVRDGVLYGAEDNAIYALELDGGQLLWRRELVGTVSAPLVAGSQVYGITHHGVHAFGAAHGAPQWSYRTEHRISAQPVLRNGELYLASLEGAIYRLRLPGP